MSDDVYEGLGRSDYDSQWFGEDLTGREVEILMHQIGRFREVRAIHFSLPPDTPVTVDPETGAVQVVIPLGAVKTVIGDWVLDQRRMALEDFRDSPALVIDEMFE